MLPDIPFFSFFLTRYIENRIYRSLFHFNRELIIEQNSNPPIIFYQGNKSVTTLDPKVDWGTTLWCQELNFLFQICGYLRWLSIHHSQILHNFHSLSSFHPYGKLFMLRSCLILDLEYALIFVCHNYYPVVSSSSRLVFK